MQLAPRRPLVLGAVILAVLVAAGILVVRVVGGDDAAGAEALTPAAAASAMLTAEDLADGYTPGDDEATSYAAQAPGCLGAVRDLADGRDTEVRVLRTFRGPVSRPLSVVTSQVSSYGSVAEAEQRLADYRAATSGCTRVRPGKGSTFDFEIATSEGSLPDADERVDLQAVGSLVTPDEQGLPFGMWVSVVRVGSNLAIVRLYEVPDGPDETAGRERIGAFTAAATARLVAAS